MQDYDSHKDALTHHKNALWVVDRAIIDAPFSDQKKNRHKITMITRMKSNLIIEQADESAVADIPCNTGVLYDQQVMPNGSKPCWRLVTYRTPGGHEVSLLTNDQTLEPGVIAFLYSPRWDEEKCFDTWENEFAMAKAWGKSTVAIDNPVRLAIITSILLAMFIEDKAGQYGVEDEESLRKQLKQHSPLTDGTDRPQWTIIVPTLLQGEQASHSVSQIQLPQALLPRDL